MKETKLKVKLAAIIIHMIFAAILTWIICWIGGVASILFLALGLYYAIIMIKLYKIVVFRK